MNYRTLGRSGVKVSVLGLGGNQFGGKVDVDSTSRIVHHALDLGVNFIDTADVYSRGKSEEALGIALHGRWDRVVLATKFKSPMGDGPNDSGMSRYHLMNAVEASLRRLQTDHIDLYQIHSWDATTPLEEVMRGLDDLVRSGKVRYLGVSNFTAWQTCRANDLAERYGWTPMVTTQPHYHMLERAGVERELQTYCETFGVGILPYFPLAGGFLTGKYQEGQPPPPGTRGESSPYVQRYFKPENFAKMRALSAWAEARGHSMAELAVAWLLANRQVSSVIAGVTRTDQVDANVKAAAWTLTTEEKAEVDKVLEG